jgi:hypothetical protein
LSFPTKTVTFSLKRIALLRVSVGLGGETEMISLSSDCEMNFEVGCLFTFKFTLVTEALTAVWADFPLLGHGCFVHEFVDLFRIPVRGQRETLRYLKLLIL